MDANKIIEETKVLDDLVKYGNKINGMFEIITEGKAHPNLKLLLLKEMTDFALKRNKKVLSRHLFKYHKKLIKSLVKGNLHMRKI